VRITNAGSFVRFDAFHGGGRSDWALGSVHSQGRVMADDMGMSLAPCGCFFRDSAPANRQRVSADLPCQRYARGKLMMECGGSGMRLAMPRGPCSLVVCWGALVRRRHSVMRLFQLDMAAVRCLSRNGILTASSSLLAAL
jgi:hypothetical protein